MTARKPRPEGRSLVMPPGRRIPRPPSTKPSRPEPPADAGDTPSQVLKAAGDLVALSGQIRECKVCGSGPFVLGTGSPSAPVMLLKGFPSSADLESGGAFTDEADALTKAFEALGIPIGWTYGTTAVRIAATTSDPQEAIAHGVGHLVVEIEAVGPQVIVAFGPEASAALSQLNGRCGLEVSDQLSPAELVRVRTDLQVLVTEPLPEGVTNKESKRRLWRDLQIVPPALS
jgi:uracil-DNA glycosylase